MGGQDDAKNALCAPVPHPVSDDDIVISLLKAIENKVAWRKAGMKSWLKKSRLNKDSHSPSLSTVLGFVFSNLFTCLHKLARGPAQIEADVLANMRKLAAEAQSRQHPTLLTSNLGAPVVEKEATEPAALIDLRMAAQDKAQAKQDCQSCK